MMLNGPARILTFPGIASPTGTPVTGSTAYAAERVAPRTATVAIAEPATSTPITIGVTAWRARAVAMASAMAVATQTARTIANESVSLG